MLMLTVDTLPWQYQVIQLVWAFDSGRGTVEINKVLAALARDAAAMGASGVIGLRFAFSEDVAERLTGTGTHIITFAYGTAVKW
jgi:hypothetical protein